MHKFAEKNGKNANKLGNERRSNQYLNIWTKYELLKITSKFSESYKISCASPGVRANKVLHIPIYLT